MDKIQFPITFNAYKHHFLFLKHQIGKWKETSWSEVKKEFLGIGENLLDFYIGKLTKEQIYEEIIPYLQTKNIDNRDDLIKWIGTNRYRETKLSDSSRWIIKPGIDTLKYIHIHPAKYSKHTLRIRATTLKTVLALQVQSATITKNMKDNLEQVNFVRQKYLHLSPIKSLNYDNGIFKIWRLFRES